MPIKARRFCWRAVCRASASVSSRHSEPAARLLEVGMDVETVFKVNEGRPNIVDHIKSGEISLVINTPLGRVSHYDEQAIRRAALAIWRAVRDDDDRRAGARGSDRRIRVAEHSERAFTAGPARDAKLDGCCFVSVRSGCGNQFSGNNSSHTR